MQVFIIGTPLETAMALDKRRLNKQIIECQQILNAIWGKSKAWKNHPCTLQYSNPKDICWWLLNYMDCLICYQNGFIKSAEYHSKLAEEYKPVFHTQEYFDQMKRRLYTKDPVHYSQWADLGVSEVNWYYVNGAWRYYHLGKQVKYNR